MSLILTEDQKDIVDLARKFAEKEVAPYSQEMDEKEKNLHRLQELIEDSNDQHRSMNDVVVALQNLHDNMEGESLEYQQTLIRGLVDRIYITTENDVPTLHMMIKGEINETYDEFYDPENLKKDPAFVNYEQTCVRDERREVHSYENRC